EVSVGSTGNDIEAAGFQRFGKGLGVFHHVLRVKSEGRPKRLAECHGLGGNYMHQRSALHTGEDSRVELFRQFLVIGQDGAAARPAKRLMSRGGYHMSMGK